MRSSIEKKCGKSGSAMIAAMFLAMALCSNCTAQTKTQAPSEAPPPTKTQAHSETEPQAQTTIKLATLVPSGTSYHHSLLAMGEKWRKDSNGSIALTIYPDGTMGSEDDIVRKMRVKGTSSRRTHRSRALIY